MNPKSLPFLLCLAFAAVVGGCSNAQETTSPSTGAPVALNSSAPSAAVEKPKVEAPGSQSAATNAGGDTNTAQIPPASANAVSQTALIAHPAGNSALPALASLSSDQVTQGLKNALSKGLDRAIASLGKPGGFLTNVAVKIPLPDKLQTAEKTLRAVGEGQLADQCITTMNQAAEQAVPAAADVFANSLKNMSIEDAKAILNGPADAATQFFRRTTEAELTKKFSPIVQQAMTKCGTTAAYQQVMDKAKSVSPFFSAPALDLNAYVTSKAMDGLFKIVADEEKNIRENPVARSTDLLKTVFGSLQK
jgi:Protein of unknown function (DUF4197)